MCLPYWVLFTFFLQLCRARPGCKKFVKLVFYVELRIDRPPVRISYKGCRETLLTEVTPREQVVVFQVVLAGIDGNALAGIVKVKVKKPIDYLTVSKLPVNVIADLLKGHAAQGAAVFPTVIENDIPFQVGVGRPRRGGGLG